MHYYARALDAKEKFPKGESFFLTFLTATGSKDSDKHMALCWLERVTRLVEHYVVNLGSFLINQMHLVAALPCLTAIDRTHSPFNLNLVGHDTFRASKSLDFFLIFFCLNLVQLMIPPIQSPTKNKKKSVTLQLARPNSNGDEEDLFSNERSIVPPT